MNKRTATPEQWARYLAQQKERYAKNKDARQARQRAYYAAHKDERIAYSTQYAKKNRDEIATYQRTYRVENREVMNTQKLESQRRRLATAETRAAYNLLQKKYRDENRPHKHAWRAKHGFQLGLVAKLRELQGNACAICRRQFDDSNKTTKGHNDHDHKTGKTRGLLCFHCNVVEGAILKIGFSPLEFGQRLHDYLLNPPADKLR